MIPSRCAVLAAIVTGACASSAPAMRPAAPPVAAAAAAPQPPAVAPERAAAPAATVTTQRETPPRLPSGCRHAEELRCSGRAPRDGEPDSTTVVICDECNADGDCTAAALGRCVSTGGQRCAGPSRRVCRYGPPCDASKQPDCPDRMPPPLPPARPGGH